MRSSRPAAICSATVGTPASARACCAATSAGVVRSTKASAPSARESTTTTWPGLRPLEHVAQGDTEVRRTEIADRPGEIGHEDAVADAEPAGGALGGAPVQPGHDGVVDVALGEAGVLEGGGERLAGERDVDLLAEALLPDVRVGLAGHPPAVQELVAGGTAPDQLGDGTVGSEDEGGRPVTALALFGRAGQPGPQVGHEGERGAPGCGRGQTLENVATAERDDPAKS